MQLKGTYEEPSQAAAVIELFPMMVAPGTNRPHPEEQRGSGIPRKASGSRATGATGTAPIAAARPAPGPPGAQQRAPAKASAALTASGASRAPIGIRYTKGPAHRPSRRTRVQPTASGAPAPTAEDAAAVVTRSDTNSGHAGPDCRCLISRAWLREIRRRHMVSVDAVAAVSGYHREHLTMVERGTGGVCADHDLLHAYERAVGVAAIDALLAIVGEFVGRATDPARQTLER